MVDQPSQQEIDNGLVDIIRASCCRQLRSRPYPCKNSCPCSHCRLTCSRPLKLGCGQRPHEGQRCSVRNRIKHNRKEKIGWLTNRKSGGCPVSGVRIDI